MKWIAVTLCAALMLATLPMGAFAQDSATPGESRGYAEREAANPGLEQFEGGFHEVIFAMIFIAAIATVVYFVLVHVEVHHRHPGCGHEVIPRP